MGLFKIASVSLVVIVGSGSAFAEPANEVEIRVHRGAMFSFDQDITVPYTAEPERRIDVLFLSDNTGSMGPVIQRVKQTAQYLFDVLANMDGRFGGRNFAYGVAHYVGDPSEGVARHEAFVLQQRITKDEALVAGAIDDWFADGGADAPESNFFALHQIATAGDEGVGGSTGVDWRPGARRIVLWFGDAPSHPLKDPNDRGTVRLDEASQALSGASITLAALNTRPQGLGIDAEDQASLLVQATGGVLAHNVVADGLVANCPSPNPFTLYLMDSQGDINLKVRCGRQAKCPEAFPGEKVKVIFSGLAPQAGTYRLKYGVTGYQGTALTVLLKVIE